jgi:hypothetical protein
MKEKSSHNPEKYNNISHLDEKMKLVDMPGEF